MPNILVTGSSSGFGNLIVQTLIENGHTVAASMRNTKTKNREAAEAVKSSGAHVFDIDVTNETSVNTGVRECIDTLGSIEVLVNNAGIGVLGLQETFTIEDWQKVFDVNVFGVQRMNRAILPHMRERGSGLLIHISSLLGRFVLPFFGPYNATKHALEAMADNYRIELNHCGIDSVIVEPGAFGTDFGRNIMTSSDGERAKSYGEFADAPTKQMEGFGPHLQGENAPKPQWVADAVLKLIETPAGKRPFRTVVDGLGMGDAITPTNEAIQHATEIIYKNFGMDGMLRLKV